MPVVTRRRRVSMLRRACARALEVRSRIAVRSNASSSSAVEEGAGKRARINRALYRARQRGFLELDIVVGAWATRTLDPETASMEFLDAFDEVLRAENPELFKWLTGQERAPRAMAENAAYASLAEHCKKFLDEKSSADTRAAYGREWIRGWNDSGAGNQ